MSELSWMDAILAVLRETDEALHYTEITERIISRGMRKSLGATPHLTVGARISDSIKTDGVRSPFVRVGRGEYRLQTMKSKSDPETSRHGESSDTTDDLVPGGVAAFGMYWRRDRVDWSKKPVELWGQQAKGSRVNFAAQIGVYLLYDGHRAVYVGQTIDGRLGDRLIAHCSDRLNGRWDRFSWFGILRVSEEGVLSEPGFGPTIGDWISSIESVLIEAMEPPQNRRRGDGFKAIEFVQAT